MHNRNKKQFGYVAMTRTVPREEGRGLPSKEQSTNVHGFINEHKKIKLMTTATSNIKWKSNSYQFVQLQKLLLILSQFPELDYPE